MDEKLLKHMAINSLALMLMVIVISIAISQSYNTKIYADSSIMQADLLGTQSLEGDGSLIVLETGDGKVIDKSITQNLGEKYLVINKKQNEFEDINLQDLYMERSLCVTIPGLKGEIFDETSLVRVNDGLEFTGMPILEAQDQQKTLDIEVVHANPEMSSDIVDMNVDQVSIDPVKGFNIEYTKEAYTSLSTATLTITLDDIYTPILYQDKENIYIDLRRPKDVYDKIIVVDAGHGGTDGGSLSEGELYNEKDINLSILLYLKEILDQEDIKVYYTRTTDTTVFLNPRVNLANDLEADFFLSIHCNANESTSPNGAEVLYNELVQTEGFQSKRLAEISLDEITKIVQNVNRGLVSGSEMLIIEKATMPIALLEIAFISNQEDLNFLLQEENKREIAGALYKTIIRAYAELEQQ